MIYLALFFYMALFPTVFGVLLYRILIKLDDLKKEQHKENQQTKRIHSKIKTSNYNNSFGNRNSYDIYKNKDGLYEPQKPHQGIELKKKEE